MPIRSRGIDRPIEHQQGTAALRVGVQHQSQGGKHASTRNRRAGVGCSLARLHRSSPKSATTDRNGRAALSPRITGLWVVFLAPFLRCASRLALVQKRGRRARRSRSLKRSDQSLKEKARDCSWGSDRPVPFPSRRASRFTARIHGRRLSVAVTPAGPLVHNRAVGGWRAGVRREAAGRAAAE